VKASLKVEYGQRSDFVYIGAVTANDHDWVELHGTFMLNEVPTHAHLYLEGPPAGVDILLDQAQLVPTDVTRQCWQVSL
jgi:hypothetical protein